MNALVVDLREGVGSRIGDLARIQFVCLLGPRALVGCVFQVEGAESREQRGNNNVEVNNFCLSTKSNDGYTIATYQAWTLGMAGMACRGKTWDTRGKPAAAAVVADIAVVAVVAGQVASTAAGRGVMHRIQHFLPTGEEEGSSDLAVIAVAVGIGSRRDNCYKNNYFCC